MAGDDDARLAILQLEARYGRTWDTADAPGWAACFADDGAFEMCSAGDAPPLRFAGAEQLTDFCRRATRRYEGIHLLSPPELTIDGDTARGWVHFQYFDRDRTTAEQRQVVGVYAVTYVRTSAGWRMGRRREQAVMQDDTFHGVPDADRMWGAELR